MEILRDWFSVVAVVFGLLAVLAIVGILIRRQMLSRKQQARRTRQMLRERAEVATDQRSVFTADEKRVVAKKA